jgi:hypothetical protein
MSEFTANEIYAHAVDLWGIDSQVDIALEELAECSLATSKLFKRQYTKTRFHDLASEIADVRIVLEQLQFILRERCSTPEGCEGESFDELVEEQYKYKLDRLATRVGLKAD